MKNQNQLTGYKLLISYLGPFLILIGLIILSPLIIVPFYLDEYQEMAYFLVPGVTSIFSGYVVSFFFKGKERGRLEGHEDLILVVAVWILAILIAAIPFMLTGKYNFTQSFFEMTSGFSTTGLSVVDVNVTSHIFLFYRSIILFVGGVGLVLVFTCVISDKQGLKLYTAEGHSDKLLPNLARSARLILSIYAGYILLGTIAYSIAGMPVFDAINHSIAALSTGGFSTKASSIAFYDSLAIEIITIVLMILGNTNFFIHLLLLKGRLKEVFKHCEIKFLIALTLIIIPVLTLILYKNYTSSFGEALQISFFQFFSCITTTGFQTVPDFNSLPHAFILLLIVVMLIGGGAGSTAGGIKQMRIVVAIKGIYYSVVDRMKGRRVVRTHYLNRFGSIEELTKEDISTNTSFVLLYLAVFLLGTFIFTCFGYTTEEAMFEFSSAISTVGVSAGITGYNANPIILWTAIVGMFLGRLELLIVFNAFSKLIKDTKKVVKRKNERNFA